MIKRVLIANRGEIALRILRACRELGLETVAAHTRVDASLLHLSYADDTVCISESDYLDGRSIIAAAKSRGCDAIHPGYGMLSESAGFARDVESAGLLLVGPSADAIATMGDKQMARQTMAGRGIQVVPGLEQGILQGVREAHEAAARIGYPVILKAAYGGGGRGMRLVEDESRLQHAFVEAQAESKAGFGSPDLYLEKYLASPRHVEVQVLGDGRGNAIHLGTRDCSVQRRHQKLLEEAPAPSIEPALLDELALTCARVTGELAYKSAGTFEFLLADGNFYFIEMNTRIQVEHPVTEMITGVDLVKAQLSIAMTGELPLAQHEVTFSGHAIECRINAESIDAQQGTVRPSPGLAYDCRMPGGPGVRVDSHLYNGYVVPHHYDSLIAKLIAWGRDRNEAVSRSQRALSEFAVRGIDTNAELLRKVLENDRFRNVILDTRFLDTLRPGRN